MLKVAIFMARLARKNHSGLTRVSHCKYFVLRRTRFEDEIGIAVEFNCCATVPCSDELLPNEIKLFV
jgi:hypothetical protein